MNPIKLMEKVAEVAPEKHMFLKKAAAEIGKGPFAEETKAELDGIMKKAMSWAGVGNAAKSTGNFLGGIGAAAGTAALGGIALALASDAYGAAKRGLTKSRNYQSMLESNPDLREAPADRVQRAFSTLHRLNPEFSGDPTVAGAFVRNQAQYEHMQWDPNQMKTLIDAHKNLQDVDRLPNFDPRMPNNMAMGPHQLEKAKQDADADFQFEKNRPGHDLHDAQRKKVDMERLMMVEKRLNERGAMAAKARAHRPFKPTP